MSKSKRLSPKLPRTNVLYLLLLLPITCSATEGYQLSDLLIAFPNNAKSVDFIQASRAWRKGVRTHILVDPSLDLRTLQILGARHNENYSVTPDFPDRLYVHGGMRHALTPLFAYGVEGPDKYKWMLVGDDDTIWVLPAVLNLLNARKLSHNDAHLISDYHYECAAEHVPGLGPHTVDPRCLPCGPGAFCPCRLPQGCTQRGFNYTQCPYKQQISAYGGAGVIYSVQMTRLMFQDPTFYLPLVVTTVLPFAPAGDVVLSEAPRLLGYGFTRLFLDEPRPPMASPPPPPVHDTHTGNRLFAPFCHFNDHRDPHGHLFQLEEAAHAQPDLFRKMVSVHARQRNFYQIKYNMSDVLSAYGGIVRLLHRMHAPHQEVTAGV